MIKGNHNNNANNLPTIIYQQTTHWFITLAYYQLMDIILPHSIISYLNGWLMTLFALFVMIRRNKI
ncbi:hypothetical protein DERP_003286 [Dermatophagoides pteronyssinus]|uniref:Uncharacterized protein n=1 Tax=Dermatophagoides pteronyssinus TaxID=6956 RepID=A0ABQ8JJ61_DERPT|nr:hypothetical protein DERP_003286 [Dermatophagoides pteronyssinus]